MGLGVDEVEVALDVDVVDCKVEDAAELDDREVEDDRAVELLPVALVVEELCDKPPMEVLLAALVEVVLVLGPPPARPLGRLKAHFSPTTARFRFSFLFGGDL